MSRIWHEFMKFTTFHFAKKVFTVSEFSKSEMIRVFKADPDKICVLGNGWQHYNRVGTDETIFERVPRLKRKEYYLLQVLLHLRKTLVDLKKLLRKIRIVLLPLLVKLKDYLQLMIWIKS